MSESQPSLDRRHFLAGEDFVNEGARDAEPCDGGWIEAGEIARGEADGPSIRAQEARDQVDDGRFSGAVRPDQPVDAARLDRQGGVRDRRQAAKALGEPDDLE